MGKLMRTPVVWTHQSQNWFLGTVFGRLVACTGRKRERGAEARRSRGDNGREPFSVSWKNRIPGGRGRGSVLRPGSSRCPHPPHTLGNCVVLKAVVTTRAICPPSLTGSWRFLVGLQPQPLASCLQRLQNFHQHLNFFYALCFWHPSIFLNPS